MTNRDLSKNRRFLEYRTEIEIENWTSITRKTQSISSRLTPKTKSIILEKSEREKWNLMNYEKLLRLKFLGYLKNIFIDNYITNNPENWYKYKYYEI